MPAHRPDVGIVHAQQADRRRQRPALGDHRRPEGGRARLDALDRDRRGDRRRARPRPGGVVLPSWVIDAVACVPGGAHPSYAHGYYERDNDFYVAWDAISRDRDPSRAWMQRARAREAVPRRERSRADEMMAVDAARRLTNEHRLLRRHRPARAWPRTSRGARTRRAACSSTRAARSARSRPKLPLSIGDGELAETADTVVSVPEMFAYWLQGGRIDVGFLGAAQIDRYGNLNSTVIGDYAHAEGAAARRRRRARDRDRPSRDVFVMLRQTRARVRRAARLQDEPRRPRARRRHRPRRPRAARRQAGARDARPPGCDASTTHARRPAGRSRSRTTSRDTEPPTDDELAALRSLETREARERGPIERAGRSPGRSGLRRRRSRSTTRATARRGCARRRGRSCRCPRSSTRLPGRCSGRSAIDELDDDLTRQHAGEPLGERIVVSGRVLDEDGRPVRGALVEVWQANAAGRYHHVVDQHPAPLDPNFSGAGRCLTDADGQLPLRHDQAGLVPLGQPRERVAPGAHPLLGVRAGVHAAARHPDVLPGRPAVRVRPDLPLGPRPEGARAAGLELRPRARRSRTGRSATAGTSCSAAAAAARRRSRSPEPAEARRRRRSARTTRSGSAGASRTSSSRPDDPSALVLRGAAPRRGRQRRSRTAWSRSGSRRSAGRCGTARGTDDGGALLVRRLEARGRGRARRRTSTSSSIARGLLKHQLTRLYFPDERAGERRRPCPRRARRGRARAARRRRRGRRLRFDIHLQGERQTIFFDH